MGTKITEIIEKEFSDILELMQSKKQINDDLYQEVLGKYTEITNEIIEKEFSDILELMQSGKQKKGELYKLVLKKIGKYIEITEEGFSEILELMESGKQINDDLCQRVLGKITDSEPLEEAVDAQCERIWKWYYDTYYQDNAKKKQGTSRSTSRVTNKETYYFDIPYQKIQFCSNLIKRNQVDPDFIKHICTAFRLDEDTCNMRLAIYGHLPLHSKNLHDLAIYSVLSTIDNINDNPLLLVKERYFKAIDIITKKQVRTSADYPIETRLLTKEIESNQFDEKNFISYVRKNAEYLNWRRSAVLREHYRLVKVFQYLYDIQQKGSSWEIAESNYSLFSFITRFCKKISHQDFGERLINEIQRDEEKSGRENRHPTREILIILWLYEEFFRGSPKISCPPKYTDSLDSCLGEKDNAFGEDRIKFDIHSYLFGRENIQKEVTVNIDGSVCKGKLLFEGATIRAIINEKLTCYGYSKLSNPSVSYSCFDKIIMKLLTLKIYSASPRVQDQYTGNWNYISSYYCEFCGSRPMDINDEYSHIVENYNTYHIPLGLAMFFEILNGIDELKTLKFPRDTQNKTKKELQQAQFLLACDLGKQL